MSYRTAPLTDYDPAHQARAYALYMAIAEALTATHQAAPVKGSYTFTRRIGGVYGPLVEAKVMILQKVRAARVSKEISWWPSGVYVCTMPELPVAKRRSEGETSISPNFDRTFSCYRIQPDEDLNPHFSPILE